MDPRIGELMKDGKIVYYAYIDGYGYDKVPTEGTLEEVEIALGLRAPIKTLRDVVPPEFVLEYMDTPAAKLLDVEVISEGDGRWPASHTNVHLWWKLANGKAVGWNENPARGWSFPVITIEKQTTKATPLCAQCRNAENTVPAACLVKGKTDTGMPYKANICDNHFTALTDDGYVLKVVKMHKAAGPKYRKYEVTVTPKVVSYAGLSVDKEYITEVIATSNADAIKKARAERAECEGTGRYVTACTYKAKLKD